MGRAIGGVILGYLVMAFLVFTVFTCAWFILGADGSFTPGTYDSSIVWIFMSFVVGFGAAVAGGCTCAAIARSKRAAQVLAGIVLVLGIGLAIPVILGSQPDPGPRTGEVTMADAMTKARQPAWVALANPILGAIGVVVGAGLRREVRS
jgi:ABC-type Na+ efflux pump permease subunit